MKSSSSWLLKKFSQNRWMILTMAGSTKEIRAALSSRMGRNAGWMLIGQGLNLLLQSGYFILLARLLGVGEYGVFAGAFAFVAIATPYSTLGSGLLFVRYVGADHSKFAAYWGNVLLSAAVAGPILTAALCLIAPHFLNPASAALVMLVGIANCIFAQLLASMGFVFQAFELLRMTALLSLLNNFLRFAAVVAMVAALPHASAKQWAVVTVYISIIGAAIGFFFITKHFGRPRFSPRMFVSRAIEGLGFSLGWSAQSAYNDIDKTLLSHYGLNIQNGIYTAAYRIVDVATTPIAALDAAALPRYVRESVTELNSVPALAIRLAKRASMLGIMTSAALFLAAPLVPLVVGHGFAETVLALRWLCFLPALRGIHYLTGCALTGAGFQRFRTTSQLCVAGLNLGLNLWLIPRYGWLGAAWTSLASDASLAVINWFLVRWISLGRLKLAS
jgi:O-antigen/teichoic acid export membrane protein